MQIGDAENKGVIHMSRVVSAPEEMRQEKSDATQKKDRNNKNGVTVDISQQALEMFKRELESSKEAADAAGKAAAEQGKILEIARRISRGDKVPPKDEKKLMEYDFKLYQMAKMSAMMNEAKKHKTHKSLFEDEEENDKRGKLRALESDSAAVDIEDGAVEMEAGTGESGAE